MDRTVGVPVGLAAVLGALLMVVVAGAIGVATGGVAAQTTNGTNVTYHENPETVAEQGDSARIRSWLSGRLTERLRESSVRISEGQYERADDVFDEEFEERVGQYVDVAGDTDGGAGGGGDGDDGGGSDSEAQTDFERAQEQQTRLASLRQEYEETYAAYLEARQQGDAEAARLHARELQQLASEIRRLGGEITRTLTSIENQSGQDTSDIQQRVENEVETTTEIQEEVQTETFRETSLEVATNRSNASFVAPVKIQGRLVTNNGTSVSNRTTRVRVGHVLYEPTTTANGTFTVVYRPAFVPVGAENVSVQYLPNTTAPYLGTDANASVSVQRADPSQLAESAGPTMTATVTPPEARFGDTLSVVTDLAVDGHAVVDVPIEATIGPEPVGTDTTSRTGTARMSGSLPATVHPGNRTVQVAVALADPAAGTITTTTPIAVRETNTELRLDASATGQGVVVRGRLVADSDEPDDGLAGRLLTMAVGDVTRTVRTDANGRFETTVARADLELADDTDSLSVRTRFDGNGTNIESARAVTTVNVSALPGGEEQTSGSDATLADRVPTGVIVLLVLAIGAGALAWRRWRHEADESTVRRERPPQPVGAGTDDVTDPDSAPLAEARAALADGATDEAVVAAYATVRAELTDRFGLKESYTPRELMAACERQLDRDAQNQLQTLTHVYERTVFAPESVEETGHEAIDAARSLLRTGSSSRDPADD